MLDNFFALNPSLVLLAIADGKQLKNESAAAGALTNASLVIGFTMTRGKFENSQFTNVRFSAGLFQQVTFTRCHFEDCLLIGTQFIDCEFHECSFVNCNTHKIIIRDTYLDPRSFHLDKQYRKKASNIGAHLYQQLFRNSAGSYQTAFAAIADVERRRWFRYQKRWRLQSASYPAVADRGLNRRKRWAAWVGLWIDVAFDWTSRYGYAPVQYLLVSSAVFGLVGWIAEVLWPSLGISRGDHSIAVTTYSQAMYYCMLLATTLGFSDLIPSTRLGWIFSIGCAILGIAWAGLFTSILVRRVIR